MTRLGEKTLSFFFTFTAFFCHPAIIQIWVPKRNKANAGQRCTLACLWVIKWVIISDRLTDWYCILICCSLTERAKISAEFGHFLWFWQKCHVPPDGWTDGWTDQHEWIDETKVEQMTEDVFLHSIRHSEDQRGQKREQRGMMKVTSLI